MDDWFKKCFLKDMIVLGIESSCDETAASVVTDKREILSNVILSQIEEHKIFGGVVPEIAARAHLEYIDNVVETAVKKAGISFADIDAVAGASGPGLIGGVLVGVMTSKAIASVLNKPYIAVNHLEGHALTARLTGDVEFPYLLLLVSGGHCQLLAVEGVGKYRQLGATIDDAAGEAFDKVAKMLKAGYPGGQSVEKLAINGDPKRFSFPRPLKNREGCDFSFSGLKTSVRRKIESMSDEPLASIVLNEQDKADFCASFQEAVCDTLIGRVKNAIKMFKESFPTGKTIVVAGGVAANTKLRESLVRLAEKENMEFAAPPLKLCTDNAAMIAWAGLERYRLGLVDGLDFKPRPRWALDPDAKGKK